MSSEPTPPILSPAPWHASDLDSPGTVEISRPAASSLPAPLTSFIGRDAEVAAGCARLTDDDVRLLTLTGPGGVGKTRLAIRIGEAVSTAFSDGVVFVPLAPIATPELVLPTIARALGIRDSGERALFEVVANLLQRRHLLLILDNLEHLREVGPLLGNLLATCPGMTILATSRVLLRLSGEHTFPISPLAVDESGGQLLHPPTADSRLATSPAVQLFVERARAVEPSFTLTANNVATIETVCRQLDGLPLAIELAAARMRILSPEALLTDLEHRLRLLTDGPHDAPRRLRTMRDAIAWSVDRLSEAERSLFCRLAVFVDGFTMQAADAIRRADGQSSGGDDTSLIAPHWVPPLDTLNVVMALIGQSLVQRADQPGESSRYRMLETIRAYALRELAARGEEASTRGAHAAWCLAFAERAEPELSGSQQKAWFDRLEAEQPNMRAALHWLLAQNDAERGLRLASALNWFWSSRSYFREARQWLTAFLALPTSAPTRGRGLLEAANILHWLGEDEQAARSAEESLVIFRDHGDTYQEMCALRRLGSIAIDQQDFDRAAHHLAESLALAQSSVAPWDARWDAAFAIFLSGRLAATAGRGDEAITCFTEAIDAFQAIGDRGYVAAALGLQGAEWIKQGNFPSAHRAYATSMELAIELSDQTWVAWAVVGAAHLAHFAGDAPTAARLLGAATAMRQAIGERRLPKNALTPALQALAENERFAGERAQGMSLAAEEAIAAARAILSRADDQRPLPGNDRQPLAALTAREQDVLQLLADGVGDKAIAATLGITRRTASQHVAAILTKLGAESRTAAVTLALRQGLPGSSLPEDT